jgi:monofunctional biosynthetic peptidoglycan transglycosylase
MLNATVLLAVSAVFGLGVLQIDAGRSKSRAESEWRTVFDFQDASASGEWSSINDGVMGGLSQGQCRITEHGALEFSGEVSLENNGGFASIRSRGPAIDLSGFDGLVARVRGDGKRYAFSVLTDYPIVAGAYYLSFEAKPEQWQDIHLPFDDFRARSFGQPVRSAPPLNKREIRSLGLLISDKQEGPFKLEVEWIKAVRALDAPSVGDDEEETDLHAE